jgi:TonB family protein
MRVRGILLPSAALFAVTAWSQQELAIDGPMTSPPAAQAAVMPDKDGVYVLAAGITPPVLLHPVDADYTPNDPAERDRPRVVIAYTVVNADGSAKVRNLLRPRDTPLEEAAIVAINQSHFQPGSLNGHAVPVLVCVRVPFFHPRSPTPQIQDCPDPSRFHVAGPPDPYHAPPGTKMPTLIHNSEAEYSDVARKKKIQGAVTLDTIVDEEGNTTGIRVLKSLGYGLDEKAVQSVSRYKFRPAMLDGHPIAVRITVEVNFKLY